MDFYLSWCLIYGFLWFCTLKDWFSLPSYWWTVWEKFHVAVSHSSISFLTTCRFGWNVKYVETVKSTTEHASVYTFRENVFHQGEKGKKKLHYKKGKKKPQVFDLYTYNVSLMYNIYI